MFTNPYPGINAHVNSMLQTPGTPEQPALWHSFHAWHIVAVAAILNLRLRPRYVALSEQSLQIRGYDMGGEVAEYKPAHDVSIFQYQPEQTTTATRTRPTWRAKLVDVVMPLIPQPRAILVREVLDQHRLGRVVTRIELLSPSNKPGGGHYQDYKVKRLSTIEENVPLVEIDYLHESAPVEPHLPRYPRDPNAYPYHILVTDPRSDVGTGEVQSFSFRVGEPFAVFPLSLAGSETIDLDLTAAYVRTLDEGPWLQLVDYTQPPERFETYSAADQARILAVMQSVAKED